MSPVINYLL